MIFRLQSYSSWHSILLYSTNWIQDISFHLLWIWTTFHIKGDQRKHCQSSLKALHIRERHDVLWGFQIWFEWTLELNIWAYYSQLPILIMGEKDQAFWPYYIVSHGEYLIHQSYRFQIWMYQREFVGRAINIVCLVDLPIGDRCVQCLALATILDLTWALTDVMHFSKMMWWKHYRFGIK